jgi:signal peptidase I
VHETPRPVKAIIIAIGIITLVAGFGVRAFVRTYRNSSASMEPTLPRNAMLMTEVSSATRSGDIVVFRHPHDRRAVMVERVIALSGETIEIRDKTVFINSKAMVEPYVRHTDDTVYPKIAALPEPYRSRDQFGPYTVPAGQFFVLGDNRDTSHDSRYWGSVPNELLIGRVMALFTWRTGFTTTAR